MSMLDNITRFGGKIKMTTNAYAPEILVGAGLVAIVAGTVMACKATLKIDDILDEHEVGMTKVHKGMELVEKGELGEDEYSVEDSKKDTAVVYLHTGIEFAKLYGPSIIVGGLGIASVLTGFGIMRSRYLALGAAYTALDKSFKTYRKRVVDEQGEFVDNHYMYGTKIETIETEYVDPDTGKKKTKKETVSVVDENDLNLDSEPWKIIFSKETTPLWENDPGLNRILLSGIEHELDRQLKKYGKLTINDVRKALKMKPIKPKYGDNYGLIYDPEDILGDGVKRANHFSFGVFETNIKHTEATERFLMGLEPAVLLELNIDGEIASIIENKGQLLGFASC